MVLAEPFQGLRPQSWESVDHLQPGSADFARALDAAALDLEAQRDQARVRLDARPMGTAFWVDDVHDGRSHRTAGLILATRVDGRGSDGVWPHERTFPDPVGRRLQTRNRLQVEPTPTLLILREPVTALRELLDVCQEPELTFTAPDGARHHAAAVPVSPEVIEGLRGIPALVADGHHRLAAANDPAATARGTAMTWLVAADRAPRLHPVHRTVRRLPSDATERLTKAGIALEDAPARPDPHHPVLVTSVGAHRLTARPGTHAGNLLAAQHATVRGLPATLVALVLQDLLGIGTRRDEMGTTVHAGDATSALTTGEAEAAVLACGPTLDQVWAAAEAGVLLPPKATWFAPKPHPGAVLRPLDESVHA